MNTDITPSVAHAIRSYGKQVAEQALNDAAENAEGNIIYHEHDAGYPSCEIDKESILNTEIKLP